MVSVLPACSMNPAVFKPVVLSNHSEQEAGLSPVPDVKGQGLILLFTQKYLDLPRISEIFRMAAH